ncbi:MAG: DEAD/DEAH box helicase family protein [Candidatus Roizmanbacteria bacterium]
MKHKEARARIKINKLLEEAGWRFEDLKEGKANIHLEAGVMFDQLGEDFEHATTQDKRSGAIDFLLLDKDGKALAVVEAKRESINPLFAKEQARNYARNTGARFVILSNGNMHYLWDTKHGNPETISRFPTQDSISEYREYTPNPIELVNTSVDENYIIASQMPEYAKDPLYINLETRPSFLKKNGLKQMRPYQVQAIKALQEATKNNKQRYLFEMATGTGKTLVSAAVIKLFLKSGNAKKILFLVDRLELEDQANKAFIHYLGKDFKSVIYKNSRDSWANASIVVSTIQTFMSGDRYRHEFSPTDFEFVISDEAHRSIGGSSRAVFEYFVGYKLGLTATPKNYLKGAETDALDNQKEYERRLLLDTYRTFGCEPGNPTYTYDLITGATEGFLIQPTLVDARTEITTQLLSDKGYSVPINTTDGVASEEVFTGRDYEKTIYNEETNVAMCKAFMDNGLLDPVSEQLGIPLFGKSIVFCVSQNHAAKVCNILNQMAQSRWPGIYNESDFAMQVTSSIPTAQQMTINFANNRLGGVSKQPEGYETSKTRITVTVGMMTTGYDCEDILNIALMRPVFSPSDFVQMKGRGTRKYIFEHEDYTTKEKIEIPKKTFKFFDFFAVCEYFESEFPYDEKIKLPLLKAQKAPLQSPYDPLTEPMDGTKTFDGPIHLAVKDQIATVKNTVIGLEGMRIDREGFRRAVQEDVLNNTELQNMWNNGDRQGAEQYAQIHVFDKPKNFISLDKIRRLFNVDRRITVREFLQVAFGEKDTFETKDELLELEWEKYTQQYPVPHEIYTAVKNFFKAYAIDSDVRDIMKTKQFARFHANSSFDFSDFEQLGEHKSFVPRYITDYAHQLISL